MDIHETRKLIERGRSMSRTHLIAALVGLIALGVSAADALAYYHQGLGRFVSRDPGPGMRVDSAQPAASRFIPRDPTGQYVDGVNLYQYVQGNPAGIADPSGLCCVCSEEPGECSIKVFLTSGRARVSNLPQMFMQIFVKVELQHTGGKSLEGCHLRQNTHGAANFRTSILKKPPPRTQAISKYPPIDEWRTEKDYAPDTTGHFPNYKDSWFSDWPYVSAFFRKEEGPTDVLTYWWQAHVWVIEADSVETYWGFQITGVNPKESPNVPPEMWGGWTYWAGRERAGFSTLWGDRKKFERGQIGDGQWPQDLIPGK